MSITNHITQVHVTGPNFAAAAYLRLSYVHSADSAESSISMLSQPINANNLSNVSIIDDKATTIT